MNVVGTRSFCEGKTDWVKKRRIGPEVEIDKCRPGKYSSDGRVNIDKVVDDSNEERIRKAIHFIVVPMIQQKFVPIVGYWILFLDFF
jgi:hypothetical protein